MPTRCAVYKGDAMTQTTPPMPVGENERIHALDALRGIALLGILTVNMGSFKGLSTLEMFPSAESLAQSANRTAFLLINTLFTGKFYPIFAFLFGLGFALQIERLQARGVNPTGIMLRRLGVLLLIGVLHGLFIWTGDVLFLYALCGMVLLLFSQLRAQAVLYWVLALAAFKRCAASVAAGLPYGGQRRATQTQRAATCSLPISNRDDRRMHNPATGSHSVSVSWNGR